MKMGATTIGGKLEQKSALTSRFIWFMVLNAIFNNISVIS
jgi:hypothetical protein